MSITKNINAEKIKGNLSVDSVSATTISGSINYNDITNAPDLTEFVPYTGVTSSIDLGNFGVTTNHITFDPTPSTIPTDKGTVGWDGDFDTISIVLNGYKHVVGGNIFYNVKNQTGTLIPKGTNVQFVGTLGTSARLLISPFIANGTVPSTFYMGVTAEDIDNGDDGKVLWFGVLKGINTNAFVPGPSTGILYASTTVSGSFQNTVPQAPNNIIQVAAVINQGTTNGSIFIRPTISSSIPGGSIGQILSKDSSIDGDYTWKPYNESIQFQIMSEGPTISDGFKGYRYIDRDMTITSARILSNSNATISFTLLSNSNTIGNIELVSNTSIIDNVLNGWSVNLYEGDYLEFYVDSPGGISTTSQATIILSLNINKKI